MPVKPKLATVTKDQVVDITSDMPKEDPKADLPAAAPKTDRFVRTESPKARPGVKHNRPVKINIDAETAMQASQYLSHMQQAPGFMDRVEPEVTTDLATTTGQLTTRGLPALINSEVILYKGNRVTPEWIEVKDLPGAQVRGIRQMGRDVFSLLTTTPLENIEVVSTLTNSKEEVAGMATWIQKHGRRITEGEIENIEQLGGYDAKAQLWYARGFEFLMIKDFAGIYIYSWDAKSSLSGSEEDTYLQLEEALNQIERSLNNLLHA